MFHKSTDRARKLAGLMIIGAALAQPALAYIGPGAGIGAFGSVITLIGGVFLLLAGFVWYPIKRVIRKFRPAAKSVEGSTQP